MTALRIQTGWGWGGGGGEGGTSDIPGLRSDLKKMKKKKMKTKKKESNSKKRRQSAIQLAFGRRLHFFFFTEFIF